MKKNKTINGRQITIAIIVIFITGSAFLAVFYINKREAINRADNFYQNQTEEKRLYLNAMPVSEEDIVLGNKKAPLKIVTYLDMTCENCLAFKYAMRQILENNKEEVAWVIRHFPLAPIGNGMFAAISSECVADLKNEDKIWDFISKIHLEEKDRNINFEDVAYFMGINRMDFFNCFNSGKFAEKIKADYNNGIETGILGVPHSVVFVENKPIKIMADVYLAENIQKIIDPYL